MTILKGRKKDKPHTLSNEKIKDNLVAWVFIMPLLVIFLVFVGLPVFKTVFYYGFTKYNMLKSPTWVGLDNFKKIFNGDPNMRDVWRATFRLPLYLIPLHVGLSLFIAYIVYSCKFKPAKLLARTTIYFPVLATTSAVAIAWSYMFHESNGVINWLLQQIGILGEGETVRWLIDPNTSMWAIVIFSAWKFLGQHFLYYYVAMQNIPDSYYEAAKIDGASDLQCFFKITIPLITPTIFFVLIICLVGTLQAFDEPYFVTAGGPGYYTTNATLYLYRKAFQSYDMGYAAAISTLLFVIVMILTIVQLKGQKKWVVYDYE